MQGYLFGYVSSGNVMGRVFYSINGPLTDTKIMEIEGELEKEGLRNACVLFVTKIDGEVTPA